MISALRAGRSHKSSVAGRSMEGNVKVYSGAGLGDFYYQVIRDITEFGKKIQTRYGQCVELPFPVVFEYEKPGHCFMRIPNRKFNPFFALAEVVWILSGSGSVDWICHFNKRMKDYADEGYKDFHGSYGLRLRHWEPRHQASFSPIDQIKCVVQKLQDDPFSRQALISIWDPERDNLEKSKDYPCNNVVYFSLRDGVLDQSVVIRSNDVIWGTPYNAVQFTHLHALVAGMLEAKIGRMTYFIQNLHYYLDLYKPTLSSIIEQAYDKDAVGAECVPNFDTITMPDFDKIVRIVNRMLKPGDGMEYLGEGVGYWGHTIPKMILIYELKERKEKLEFIDGLIQSLGQPLIDLIHTFYSKESK